MLFLKTAAARCLSVALVAGLLAGCKKDDPTAPTPVTPTPVNPNPTTPTYTQYGTPFAGVPDRADAVIYQVNMRAFSQAGNFAGVTARLDSIKALGANVVYLMPIYPVGQVKSVNSPYCVKDYSAVGSEFGTLTDLRTLVDGAHQRNMSVMLDWVANHTSWDNAWISAHKDWYAQDASGNIISPPNTTFTDVAQLNFNSQAMRAAMIAAMKGWVYTANVDGFRCDYADAPNIAATNFWKQTVDTLRAIKTHKLLLLAEGTSGANITSGFDYNFGFGTYGTLKSIYGSNASAANYATATNAEYGTNAHYTTNHDVNGSDGTPVQLYGGNAGAMSAFVIASCYKGVPFIYNGQEAGMTQRITFPFTSQKVQWGAHPDVTRAYQKLLAVRAASTALRAGSTTDYSTSAVCAFTKTAGSGEKVLVVVNTRSSTQSFTVPSAVADTYTDLLNNTGSVDFSGAVSLAPYSYTILKK